MHDLTQDGPPSLPRLRETLATRGASQSALIGADPVRRGASDLGRSLARHLDARWKAARRVTDGPVDVMDFFSGCGGMSTGFRAVNGAVAAYRLIGAVDIDPVACKTYEMNLGTRPFQEDVGRLASNPRSLRDLMANTRRRRSAPFVLIGCAPCQGFSSHRNARGQGDVRNSLFANFARVAAALEPDVIVIENVPEVLADAYWPIVAEARAVLEKAGYMLHTAVHNMAAYGVPQERFRGLMLGMRRGFRAPSGFLPRDDFRTVRDAIGDLPAVNPGEVHSDDPMHYSAGHRASTVATIRRVPRDGGSRPAGVGPACLVRIEQRQGRAAYEDVYGRLWWDKPAITVTAYARNPASGRFVHPEQHRGLTVREAALLQGFPRDFMLHGTLDERFRQIGNAVPPPFAGYLGLHVLGELLGRPVPADEFEAGITAPVGPSFSRLIPALKAGHRNDYAREAV